MIIIEGWMDGRWAISDAPLCNLWGDTHSKPLDMVRYGIFTCANSANDIDTRDCLICRFSWMPIKLIASRFDECSARVRSFEYSSFTIAYTDICSCIWISTFAILQSMCLCVCVCIVIQFGLCHSHRCALPLLDDTLHLLIDQFCREMSVVVVCRRNLPSFFLKHWHDIESIRISIIRNNSTWFNF